MSKLTVRANARTLPKSRAPKSSHPSTAHAQRKSKQNRTVSLIADRMPPLSRLLLPHVTDMPDGTFRPEVVIGDDGLGDIHFGAPVDTLEMANRMAVEACKRGVLAAVEALTGRVTA